MNPFGPRPPAAVVAELVACLTSDRILATVESRDSEVRDHVLNGALTAVRAAVSNWYIDHVGSEEDLQLEVIKQELGQVLADVGVCYGAKHWCLDYKSGRAVCGALVSRDWVADHVNATCSRCVGVAEGLTKKAPMVRDLRQPCPQCGDGGCPKCEPTEIR